MKAEELRAKLHAFQGRHGIRSYPRVRDLYAVRQVLVRLQQSEHADRFMLKGGMFVGAVLEDFHRTTRDADVLAYGPPDPAQLKGAFEEIAAVELDDGVVLQHVQARLATRGADGYDGVKVVISAQVANEPAKASIDIGYGDAVVPEGEAIEVPKLFEGGEQLVMPAYSLGAFLAEKTETVVSGFPGKTLPRLKDFYDIATVTHSWSTPMAGSTLLASFKATFERRGTEPDAEVFEDVRAMAVEDGRMEREWADFKERVGVGDSELDLLVAIERVAAFTMPLLCALTEERAHEQIWVPGTGWGEGPN